MGPKAVLPGLWLLFLVSAGPFSSCVRAQTAPRTATVNDSGRLLAALQSDADVLVLQSDVALGSEFDQFDGTPLRLRRCAAWLNQLAWQVLFVQTRFRDMPCHVGTWHLDMNC
jgi:hypothetical protein